MRIERLDPRGLRRMEEAVRRGEPVWLGCRPLAPVQIDEIVPLCHAVDDPSLQAWLPPGARPGSGIRVSVVIPTHRTRPIGIAAYEGQDVEVELLVLANGPYGDGIRVPWLGHGETRNLGVRMARSPYVLFTVDDALPLGAGFLRTLVEALEEGGFDAVFARQVPWPTSDPVTRARLRGWTPPSGEPEARLDNVAALYRRSVLQEDPFDPVEIAEDDRWARRHRIGYVPTAPVAHAHVRRFAPLFARTRAVHRALIDAGDPPRVPGLLHLARALPSVLGRDAPGALGELLGQYAAARDRR